MAERLPDLLEQDRKDKRVIQDTVELEPLALVHIIAEIAKPRSHFEQMEVILRPQGYIGINGTYALPNNKHISYGDIARLVDGSLIGERSGHTFLQIYAYPTGDAIYPVIDLAWLLRNYREKPFVFPGIRTV